MRHLGLGFLAWAVFAAPLCADELGSITFRTSGTAEAQPHFLEGVKALHNFQFAEAANAFARAQELDPDFALAFWGEAMSYNHPLWGEQDLAAARAALERLAPTVFGRLAKAELPKERALMEAAEHLFYGSGSKLARDEAYAEYMTGLHERWPEDHEIATFYALSLLGTVRPGDTGFRRQARAAAAMLEVFAENPEHPGAAHFIIHAFDDPDHAPLALPAARRYAEIAPAAAHALHMPSHIFVQLGHWQAVVDSNIESYEAAVETNRRLGLPEGRSDFHALSWLAYGHLMLARYESAAQDLRRAREAVTRNPESERVMNGYLEMRARHLVETRNWPDIELRVPEGGGDGFEATVPSFEDAATSTHGAWLLAAGIAAAAQGSERAATAAETQLERLGTQREIAGDTHGARQLLVMSAQVAASIASNAGRVEQALRAAAQAAELERELGTPSGPPVPVKPAVELYGEVLLEAGRAAEAVAAFERSLGRMPMRTPSLLGLARAHEAAGNAAAAREAYAEIAAMPGVRAESAAVREAEKYLAASSGGN